MSSALHKISDSARGAISTIKNGIVETKYKLYGQNETVSRSERFDAISVLLGRIGFFSRGFIWCAVGGFAMNAAVTLEPTEGTSGAVTKLSQETVGYSLLIVATIGIFAYAFWRFFEGFFKLNYNPEDTKFKRVLNGFIIPFASCIAYVAFAVTNIMTIKGSKGNDGQTKSWSAAILSHFIGKLFFTAISIVIVGVAIGWIVNLVKRKFKKALDYTKIEADEEKMHDSRCIWRRIVYVVAVVGTTGRAFLFILLGALIMRVAWDSSVPLGGFGEALGQLLAMSIAGRIILAIVGFMLVIFGVFSILQSRYKKFMFYHPRLERCVNPDI